MFLIECSTLDFNSLTKSSISLKVKNSLEGRGSPYILFRYSSSKEDNVASSVIPFKNFFNSTHVSISSLSGFSVLKIHLISQIL